jgi:hypothetical protein
MEEVTLKHLPAQMGSQWLAQEPAADRSGKANGTGETVISDPRLVFIEFIHSF